MRVLLATDGSEDARAATAWLEQFPLPPGSALRVVSAVSAPPAALGMPMVRDLQQSVHTEGQRVADDARAALTKRFATADVYVGEGDACRVILAAADPRTSCVTSNRTVLVVKPGARGAVTP